MPKGKPQLTFEEAHPWVVEDMLEDRPVVRFTNPRTAVRTAVWLMGRDARHAIKSEWRVFHAFRSEVLDMAKVRKLIGI